MQHTMPAATVYSTVKGQLEINTHHLRGNAIPVGPLSDSDEILCRWWIPKSVLLSKILTLWVQVRCNLQVTLCDPYLSALSVTYYNKGRRYINPLPLPLPFYRNVGLSSSKVRKFRIFGKNLSPRDKSPLAIFLKTKLGTVEDVPGPYPHAKLHGCGFKNQRLQVPKLPKLLIFGINLPKGVYPINRFLQYLAQGR